MNSSDRKAAQELVRVARELSAIPMAYLDPSSETVRWARNALMTGLRVNRSWKEVYSEFMTLREGTANRFHYFGVYVDPTTGEAVGGNAYGRIGYTPKSIEVARGRQGSVMSAVQAKADAKRNRGYSPTEV